MTDQHLTEPEAIGFWVHRAGQDDYVRLEQYTALSAKLEAAEARAREAEGSAQAALAGYEVEREARQAAEAERDALDAAWSERVALLEETICKAEAEQDAAFEALQAWDDDSDHCGDDWFDDRLRQTRAFLAARQKGGE